MPIDTLKEGIRYAMKENLMVQYILPDYALPEEYKEVMNSIDFHLFVPAKCEDENAVETADVLVFDTWEDVRTSILQASQTYVLRIGKDNLFAHRDEIKTLPGKVKRLNIVLTDVERFTEEDFGLYQQTLTLFAEELERLFLEGQTPQLNLLTDRMMLDKANHCNAGVENITLAPDGRFYICPAFYQAESGISISESYSVGDLVQGLNIPNAPLYQVDHAPLCRICDAYQCKRCVWLNRKTTNEVNTPGHEQCVVAHLERNAARQLLLRIRRHGPFLPEREIKEIDYLDPFEVKEEC